MSVWAIMLIFLDLGDVEIQRVSLLRNIFPLFVSIFTIWVTFARVLYEVWIQALLWKLSTRLRDSHEKRFMLSTTLNVQSNYVDQYYRRIDLLDGRQARVTQILFSIGKYFKKEWILNVYWIAYSLKLLFLWTYLQINSIASLGSDNYASLLAHVTIIFIIIVIV